MSRRDKLIDRMRSNPGDIRFAEVEALLQYMGFVRFNARGSHRTYHRNDGLVLTLVMPHGGRKTCHPSDINKVLEALDQ